MLHAIMEFTLQQYNATPATNHHMIPVGNTIQNICFFVTFVAPSMVVVAVVVVSRQKIQFGCAMLFKSNKNAMSISLCYLTQPQLKIQSESRQATHINISNIQKY